MPAEPRTSPIPAVVRRPSVFISTCESPAPIAIPTVKGRNASPASSGENSSTRWM
jgi:hypothetical protein